MSRFKDGFHLCMLIASLIFRLCQFSSRSRIFTSHIEHWWPVFNLCSPTADRGWRHDRCSLILINTRGNRFTTRLHYLESLNHSNYVIHDFCVNLNGMVTSYSSCKLDTRTV